MRNIILLGSVLGLALTLGTSMASAQPYRYYHHHHHHRFFHHHRPYGA